jgi:2-polyprenyl-6-methoxyphenol hydroxylase-like FAD-dependent oxidoreductase
MTVTRIAGSNLGMPDVSTLIKTLEKQNNDDDADQLESEDRAHQRQVEIKKVSTKPKII